jgi:predicted nucleic acid-binding Zn ribbon protein
VTVREMGRTRGHGAARPCEQCGVTYLAVQPTQRFCGDRCRGLRRSALRKAARPGEAAERACARCGAAYAPVRSDQRYCGRRCARRAGDARRARRQAVARRAEAVAWAGLWDDVRPGARPKVPRPETPEDVERRRRLDDLYRARRAADRLARIVGSSVCLLCGEREWLRLADLLAMRAAPWCVRCRSRMFVEPEVAA